MFIFYTIILLLVLFCILAWYIVTPKAYDIVGAHVMITGGSSGIGKSLAIDAVQRGASVTLFARNKVVQGISCDVSGDYNKVEGAVKQAEERLGPVNALINCAGISAAGRFEDVPIEEFQKLMNVNYIGSVYVTRAVIKQMKRLGSGRIVFVSSQAGQLGLYGYSPYSPTKFALKGLAEALQMEVAPYNIRVTLSFPPDTETPGFRDEMNSGLKPEETILISETSGLFKPEVVAKAMIDDMLAGKFQSYVGLDGWMLCNISAGMCPITSLREFVEQVFLSGLLRSISVFYLLSFDAIVKKCKAKRDTDEQKKDK